MVVKLMERTPHTSSPSQYRLPHGTPPSRHGGVPLPRVVSNVLHTDLHPRNRSMVRVVFLIKPVTPVVAAAVGEEPERGVRRAPRRGVRCDARPEGLSAYLIVPEKKRKRSKIFEGEEGGKREKGAHVCKMCV